MSNPFMFQTTNQWYMLPLVDVTFPTFMWFCNAKKGVDPSPNPLNICPKPTSILLEPEPEGRDCCYEKILHVFWLPIEICWSNPTLRETVRAPKKTVAQTWIWPFKGKKVPDSQNPILYIYIHMYTYIYIYTHIQTYIHIQIHTYIYMYMYMYPTAQSSPSFAPVESKLLPAKLQSLLVCQSTTCV